MIKEIFTDKTGKLSSKRIMGCIIVTFAMVLTVIEKGNPATVQTLIWAGVASLGVGTLETKVSK